ncbi:cytochrome b/b6 domain-containing protein [Methylococcus mesophilus]|uniref:cytochrome b/b6 domain-containing protein n=1 Tax=Methylococcus mesophilus TaxID=2993564 RepID=UPI00224A9CC4|nr:cytochrome b/b6 domain-containing protein [Methylococcus mesophilus]UZR29560.1 cytochrome b/b6 domain-containing protein [Methylococcus mesophilus]
MKQRILVWDLPTRIFHWTLALSFAGAYLTAESERWRDIHVLLGYTLAGLIAFRLIWGFTGTRYARFAEFVRGPSAITRYLKSLADGRPEHHVGHNPAGAVFVVLLLLLGIASGVSGWMVLEDSGGEWLEEVHEFFSNAMLAVVAVHILGVIVSSRLHGENLTLAMLTGRKQGEAGQAIPSPRPLAGLFLLAGLLGFWGWSVYDAGTHAETARSSLFGSAGPQEKDEDDD